MKLRDFLGGEQIAEVVGGVTAISVDSLGVDLRRKRFLGGKLCVSMDVAEQLFCSLYGEDPEPEPDPI